jgi:hypothetical protein
MRLTNAERAITDIWVFADLINFHGGSKKFGIVHKKMSGFLTSPQTSKVCLLPSTNSKYAYNRRRLVEMPRGHLKSSVCSILYVLWRIYRNENIRILYGTNVVNLSESFVREIRQYLEDADLQETVWNNRPHRPGQKLIPVIDRSKVKREETSAADKKIIWTVNSLQVLRSEKMKEPTVKATSTGARVTGEHYDLLILDDIVDFDNTSNEARIEKVFDWAQDMESVIDPERTDVLLGSVQRRVYKENVGDEVVVLGTRYANKDYYNYLEANAENLGVKIFKRCIYRNGVDERDGYIWSEKFNDEYVKRLKARLTPRRWSSQYLNKVISSDAVILNREQVLWIPHNSTYPTPDGFVELRGVIGGDGSKLPTIKIRPYIVIDPAISQAKTADSTCIMVGGVDSEDNLYCIDYEFGSFLPHQTAELLQALCLKYNTFVCHLENNGVGAAFSYTLKLLMKGKRAIAIKDHKVGSGNRYNITGDKKLRIENRLVPLIENQKLYIAQKAASHPKIIDEFDFFPSNNTHDDFLDCLDQLAAIAKPMTRLIKGNSNRNTNRVQVNSKYGGVR